MGFMEGTTHGIHPRSVVPGKGDVPAGLAARNRVEGSFGEMGLQKHLVSRQGYPVRRMDEQRRAICEPVKREAVLDCGVISEFR